MLSRLTSAITSSTTSPLAVPTQPGLRHLVLRICNFATLARTPRMADDMELPSRLMHALGLRKIPCCPAPSPIGLRPRQRHQQLNPLLSHRQLAYECANVMNNPLLSHRQLGYECPNGITTYPLAALSSTVYQHAPRFGILQHLLGRQGRQSMWNSPVPYSSCCILSFVETT